MPSGVEVWIEEDLGTVEEDSQARIVLFVVRAINLTSDIVFQLPDY